MYTTYLALLCLACLGDNCLVSSIDIFIIVFIIVLQIDQSGNLQPLALFQDEFTNQSVAIGILRPIYQSCGRRSLSNLQYICLPRPAHRPSLGPRH